MRVTDLAVTPDLSRLVAVGMQHLPPVPVLIDLNQSRDHNGEAASTPVPTGASPAANGARASEKENRMIIYDMATKETQSSIRLEGELTSVKVSRDSQYALINHAPDEVHLWDLSAGRLACKFTGQRQGRHVIRSCFGGIDANFVVSGSEDGNVYVWHRDTGTLLEVLAGHGSGSVNSVAWNPRNEKMFASCSDDHTIRIWEAPSPDMGHSPSTTVHYTEMNGKGKGKTRQRWDGDGDIADFGPGVDATRT